MRKKIGVVCAFIEEEPKHSPYDIRGLVNTLSCISDLSLLCVANGAEVSDELRTLFDKTPDATLLELEQNIGVPGAWNLGLEQLDCDALFVLNDDLWFDAECIVKLSKFIKEKPDTAVVGVEGVICDSIDDNGFPMVAKKFKKPKRSGFFNTAKKWSEGGVDVSAVNAFLFALSGDFIKKTNFRFDTLYTPAFCEEFDLAYFARSAGYKTRILLGLNTHYDHIPGISSGEPVEIEYLGKKIKSDELYERNKKLFCEKWKGQSAKLLGP